jgi:tetratricopeptide (TPR) repeat protein
MSLEKHEAYEIYTRAEGHYRAGNLEEALRELDALLDSFPDEPRLINAKALCLQKLGRAIEAQHAFERLRQLPEKKSCARNLRDPDTIGNSGSNEGQGSSRVRNVAVLLMAACILLSVILGSIVMRPGQDYIDEVTAKTPQMPPTETKPDTSPRIPFNAKLLIKDLENPYRREEAWARLLQESRENDLEDLHAGFRTSRSNDARWRLGMVLGSIGSENSAPVLASALATDKSEFVRRASAFALGLIRSPRALQPLQEALHTDPVKHVRNHAAWSIDQILGKRAEPILLEALESEEHKGMIRALRWLLDYEMKGTRPPKIVPGQAHWGIFKDTQFKVYFPRQYSGDREWPLLVAVHGTDGHPGPNEKMWREDADRYGFVVSAPFF